jgi:hypothetical protein
MSVNLWRTPLRHRFKPLEHPPPPQWGNGADRWRWVENSVHRRYLDADQSRLYDAWLSPGDHLRSDLPPYHPTGSMDNAFMMQVVFTGADNLDRCPSNLHELEVDGSTCWMQRKDGLYFGLTPNYSKHGQEMHATFRFGIVIFRKVKWLKYTEL